MLIKKIDQGRGSLVEAWAVQFAKLENHLRPILHEARGKDGVYKRAETARSNTAIAIVLRDQCIVLIENVEGLQADLQIQALADFRVFEDRHVGAKVAGPCKAVASRVAPTN